ncbi:MAG: GTPase HflX [Methanomassiliicoccales archaeon PtaU1.Bin124]|nr:MAG: GTPase HflX [Methanomassiliicoccales archaeon PtaU1.Bin124]
MEKRKYIKKVALLGEGAVGKTSLVRRYVLDVFSDDYIQTFGAKVTKKVLEMESVELTMMIWDILGQKSNSSLHSTYYSGSNGALLVFDLTRPETLEAIPRWLDDLKKVTGNIPFILVANKADLHKEIAQERMDQISSQLNTTMMFTSAKNGTGVDEAFMQLSLKMMGGV